MPLTQVQNGMLAGVIPASLGGTGTTAGVTGFKNRLINGDMTVDQRNNGASVSTPVANSWTYFLDRWAYFGSNSGRYRVQQNAGSVTPPAGFTNYLGVTSLAATTVGAADVYDIKQSIEGFNIADLGWGTANAKTITLSFWVRSSLTGAFGGSLTNGDFNRLYPFSYTISTANTWEQKSITIAGDTTGTWYTNNNIGVNVVFGLGVGSTYTGPAGAWATGGIVPPGSTSVVSTNGATWYMTGCQFEVGSAATNFDYLPYGTELQLCYRYYFTSNNKIGGGSGNPAYSGWSGYTDDAYTHICSGFNLPVDMRAAPTMTVFSGNGNGWVDGFGRGQYGGGFAGVPGDAIMTYTINYVSARAGGGSNTFATGSIMRGGYIASAEL
jgi:hypothetical protein